MDINWTTFLGLTAACCTTFSFVPQVIKTIQSKETRNISLTMYVTLTSGLFLWLVYGLINMDLPLILANAVSCSLSAWVLLLKMRHG